MSMNNNRNIVEFIKSNQDILDLISDLIPIPLFIKDRAGLYISCNDAFKKFLSFSREEIIGKSVYEIWKKEEADVFFSQDNELFEKGGLQVYETEITSSEGVKHIVQFHKQVFMDSAGNVAGFLGAIFDITEEKKLEQELAKLATVDELTGLPNRRDGMLKLEVLHKDSERKKHPYCIAMIDLDHFKKINDLYGHNNGDIVLKEFSKLAKSMLRSRDVCFRYGGEEFVILLPETELSDAFDAVECLRQAWDCKQLILPDCQPIHSTVSIGLIQYPINCVSWEQLLKESDKALYDAKNSGRNCTVYIHS